jgi:CBS domain-containing protein
MKPSIVEVIVMLVREVMSERVVRVTPDYTVHDVAVVMRDGDIGIVPVEENDRLIGVITDRDLVVRGLAETDAVESLCAEDVMSARVLYCYDDQPVEDVLNNMAQQQIRRLPVVSREKRLVGIVSLGDLAKESPRSWTGATLEQISMENPH